MIKFILPLLMILMIKSNESKLIGYVIDKNTNEELCGVRVIINNDTTYTDFDGCFYMENVLDTTNIELSLISYEKKDFIIVTDNQLIVEK